MKTAFVTLVSIAVGILVAFDCASLALSVYVVFGYNDTLVAEPYLAGVFSAGASSVTGVGLSLFLLLFVALPTCVCSCYRENDNRNCCTPTYVTFVVIVGSISVAGTFFAGMVQMFTAYTFKGVASDAKYFFLLRSAAALNLVAALYGILVTFATFCTCWAGKGGGWLYCKTHQLWSHGIMIILLTVTALVISILVASTLTLYTYTMGDYSSEPPAESPNNKRMIIAFFLSGSAAVCLLVGICVCIPCLCCCKSCYHRKQHLKMNVARIVVCIWAVLTTGTVAAGGLMMKVGHSFASGEETLNPEKRLNRDFVSATAYFIGGMNFVTTFIAIVLFCMGLLLRKKSRVWEMEYMVIAYQRTNVCIVDLKQEAANRELEE